MPEVPGGSAPTQDEWQVLLRKAEQGDSTVLPVLRTWMDRTPGHWEALGNLATVARDSLIEQASGTNLLTREALTRTCAALTRELTGATPPPLERLVVERIVLCWLYLHHAETMYAQHMDTLTYQHAAVLQQRISMGQARYLAAIRTLAQVRRLGVPAVQVNIGGQQVNMAGEH